MDREQIAGNLRRVRERIAAAARKSGRTNEEITLIGVSKTQPAEAIRAAFEGGLRNFGENRVQEWEGKRAALGDLQATWHLVGHLQSNKAARAAGLFHSVDSVDDFAVAQRLDRAPDGQSEARKLRVLPARGAGVSELFRQALRYPPLSRRSCFPPLPHAPQAGPVTSVDCANCVTRWRAKLAGSFRCYRWGCRTISKWRSRKAPRKCG